MSMYFFHRKACGTIDREIIPAKLLRFMEYLFITGVVYIKVAGATILAKNNIASILQGSYLVPLLFVYFI